MAVRRSRTTNRLVATVGGVLLLAPVLAACSGSGESAAPTSAGPTGPCEKGPFAAHVGLAAGAVQTYVWKPFGAGAFDAKAKDRVKALAAAGQASTLAANELAAAKPLVVGCASGTRLLNALTTGGSLSASGAKQLAAAKPNPETLAGMNSILSTVIEEAKAVGIPVTTLQPTVSQLQAGKAS